MESLCTPVGEWLRIDLAKQANAYSIAEIDILKRVADIVFSLGCFEFSFPLYVLLLKRSLLSSSPESVEQRILIACMRSAATEEHILVARQLMEEMLDENANTEQSPLANIPPVLIPLLLAAICFQQDDKEAALQYTTLANGHCLSPPVSMTDDGIRFMDAGSKVNKDSSSCKCVAPTEDLLQSHDSPTFPCLIPSPGCSSCCMVRKCLKSCHSLFLTAFAPSPLEDMGRRHVQVVALRNNDWGRFTAIFCTLLEGWWTDAFRDASEDRRFLEEHIGQSTTEFLAILSHAILSHDKVTDQISVAFSLRYLQDQLDLTYLSRAARAARTLSELGNDDLVNELMRAFTKRDHILFCRNPHHERSARNMAHSLAWDLLWSTSLDVPLTGNDEQQQGYMGDMAQSSEPNTRGDSGGGGGGRGGGGEAGGGVLPHYPSSVSSGTKSFFKLAGRINQDGTLIRPAASPDLTGDARSLTSRSDWDMALFMQDDPERMSGPSKSRSRNVPSTTMSMSSGYE